MTHPDAIAHCLILHDWDGALDQVKWLETALQFFFEVSSKPNIAHVGKVDGGGAKLQPKTVQKRLAEGTRFRWISLACTRPPHDDVEKWTVSAEFNLLKGRSRTLTFIYEAQGPDIDVGLFTDLLHRVSALVRPAYGYGFQRPFSMGPGWYAYDMIYGLDKSQAEDAADAGRIVLWHQERLDMILQNKPAPYRHLQGMQRDVFPFNVLTSTHLSWEIEGVSFGDWVAANASRGRLNLIQEGLWGWTVPDSLLPGVRDSLQAAGLLITRPPTSLPRRPRKPWKFF